MNKIYRTVWSETRGAYVVAHEKSKARGKPSSCRTGMVSAVAAALLALGAGQALAANVCTGNSPSISTPQVSGDSCEPDAGVKLVIGPNGVLSGATDGVDDSQGARSITNQGTIAGLQAAIFVPNSTLTGAIDNAGTIIGGRVDAARGIDLESGARIGSIVNSGLIAAQGITEAYGIQVVGSTVADSIANVGSISATSGFGAYGILLGTLNGNIDFAGHDVVGSISNSGAISASVKSASVSAAVSASAGGISVWGSSVTGSIVNSGSIDARIEVDTASGTTTVAGAFGIDVYSGASVGGGVTNSGSISAIAISGGPDAFAAGIDAYPSSIIAHGIVNSGRIDAQATSSGDSGKAYAGGIFAGYLPTISGGIANSGAISARVLGAGISAMDAYGIIIYQYASVAGGITNSGSGSLSAVAENRGTGKAYAAGIRVLSHAALAGGIVNGGTIFAEAQGAKQAAAAGIGVSEHSTVNDGIFNSGRISAFASTSGLTGGAYAYAFGIGALANATVNGGITNSGYISASADISATGSFSGAASDIGIGVGVNHATVVGNIVNLSTGTIAGSGGSYALAGTGISIDTGGRLTGTVVNAGLIKGSFAGIYVGDYSRIDREITNTGSIAGGIDGIQLAAWLGGTALVGGISNSGTGVITGGIAGVHLQVGATVSGDIVNAGTVLGLLASPPAALAPVMNDVPAAGIDVEGGTVTGAIANSGTISGVGDGIRVEKMVYTNSQSVTGTFAGAIGGGISNTGLIHGLSNSIYVADSMSTVTGGVVNSENGKLVGGLYLGNGTSLVNDGSIVLETAIALTDAAAAATARSTIGGSIANGTVTGNYTQGANGMLRIAADSATATGGYSSLTVTGTATLASGTKIDVDVKNAGVNLHVGETLTGVIVAGTLAGTAGTLSGAAFSNATTGIAVTDNSALLRFIAVKDANGHDVDLNVQTAFTVLGSTRTTGNTPAAGAASVLDAIIANTPPAMNGVVTTLQGLQTEQQVSDAASQTLPLLTGGGDLVVLGALSDINHVVKARIENNLGLSSGDGFLGDKRAWLKPFGSWADQHDDQGVAGYKANTGGFALGGDAALSDRYRFGLAFAYANSSVNSKSSVAPQSATIDLYHLIAYGSYTLSPDTELNYQFDIGNDRIEGTRRLSTFGSTAKSTYDAWTVHAGVGIGRTYQLSAANSFTPSARVDYTSIRDTGYHESGAGALDLEVDRHTTEQLLLSVDAKFAHKVSDSTTLLANLGGAYDANAKQASITAAFAGDPGAFFTTQGMKPAAWTTRGGLGVVSNTAGGTEITGRYDVDSRRGFTNQTFSVKARWAF